MVNRKRECDCALSREEQVMDFEDQAWETMRTGLGDPAVDSAISYMIDEAIDQLTMAPVDAELEALFAAPSFVGADH